MPPSAELQKVFENTPDISQVVSSFDFNQINPTNEDSSGYLQADFAPSYGLLNNRGYMKRLDEDTQIALAGTVKSLQRGQEKNFSRMMSELMQSFLLQPPNDRTDKQDRISKKDGNPFKTDGSTGAAIVNEVQTWLVNLIQDDRFLSASGLNVNVIAQIVSKTGAIIENLKQVHGKTLVDITVLQFPDIEHRTLKLHRLKLAAYHQDNEKGISAEYTGCAFGVRTEVIRQITQAARQKAIGMAESLFDD